MSFVASTSQRRDIELQPSQASMDNAVPPNTEPAVVMQTQNDCVCSFHCGWSALPLYATAVDGIITATGKQPTTVMRIRTTMIVMSVALLMKIVMMMMMMMMMMILIMAMLMKLVVMMLIVMLYRADD